MLGQRYFENAQPIRRVRAGTIFLIATMIFSVMTVGVSAQTHEGMQLVEARLVANSETVVPGRPILLGLHLKMAPGWHTYWKYSGDSGLPISLDLELPEGFRTTALQWPLPHRFSEVGDLETYGYKDEVLLLMRLFPPAKLEASEWTIEGVADWLVCEAICLPGSAEVSLTLRAGDELEPVNTELFGRFRQKLPERFPGGEEPPFIVVWERTEDALVLEATGVETDETWSYDFYPLPSPEVVLGHPETTSVADGRAVIRIPFNAAPPDLDRLPGVLVMEAKETGERQGWQISGG